MNLNLLVRYILPFFAISLGLAAQQQKDSDSLKTKTTALEEVVISDSRFPLKRSQSGKPIIKIKADEISKFQGLGLSELVRQYAPSCFLLSGKFLEYGNHLTHNVVFFWTATAGLNIIIPS